jgi:small-conductance mechanosensitive channel
VARFAVSSLVDLLNEHTPLSPPFGGLVVVLALFGLAWLVSRGAGRLATFIVLRGERKHPLDVADSGVIASLKQRETAISLARTTVRFFAYALAALLSLGVLLGADKVQTVAGASFLVIILAFAAQRFLLDVVAGALMFHERWFQIGDTIVIEPLKIEGVVEAATLRTVTLRNVGGDVIRVSNSEVKAVRVVPRGYRQVEAELFVTDADSGRELVRQVASIVPTGPTHFIRTPAVAEVDRLEDDLYRIRAVAAVPVGREWLAEDLLPSLVAERAPDDLVVHGPVVMWADEHAEHRFARATRTPVTARRARHAP